MLHSQECVKFLKEILVNTPYDAEEGVIQQPQATIANICWESCPLFIKFPETSVFLCLL
jgi:CCR4-NOT transcription complex subunit 1